MKALVVRQPWASLIALGVKTIETRGNPPNGPMRPDGVRGLPGCTLERGERIAIVAGAVMPPSTMTSVGRWALYGRGDTFRMMHLDGTPTRWEPLPRGAMVCTAVVADALPIIDATNMRAGDGTDRVPDGLYRTTASKLWLLDNNTPWDATDQELPYGDFRPGRWGWMLTDVEPCKPVPVKGRQGVFRLPDDAAEALS